MYTVTLHGALAICVDHRWVSGAVCETIDGCPGRGEAHVWGVVRIEGLVCRFLLEKKGPIAGLPGRSMKQTWGDGTSYKHKDGCPEINTTHGVILVTRQYIKCHHF